MPNTFRRRSGRPRVSSREMLADAAGELFIEQTYAGTTVDDIARRAGVSRATFFNYANTKSDLLWITVDDALDALPRFLADPEPSMSPMIAVLTAVIELSKTISPSQVPLVLTQVEVIGADTELYASALPRFFTAVGRIASAISERSGYEPEHLLVQSAAAAVVAALVSAVRVWAYAGVRRGSLDDFVSEALTPVCSGYSNELIRRVD